MVNARGGLGAILGINSSHTGKSAPNVQRPPYRKQIPLYLVMMRINLKTVCIGVIAFGVLTLTIYLFREDSQTFVSLPKWNRRYNGSRQLAPTEEIECIINQEYPISCRKENDEIYIPFSFLHKYFEVYGTITSIGNIVRFNWSHSNAKVNHPKGVYDSKGVFTYFENYHVEMRDRVKCISGIEGVPISTQWDSQGYFYSTQIAQFGLSHYSKNLTEPEPTKLIIDNGDLDNNPNWVVPVNSTFKRYFDNTLNTNIIAFKTTNLYNSSIKLPLDIVLDLVLSIDILFNKNTTLIVTLQIRDSKKVYNIHYIMADLWLSVQDENIYYGIGQNMSRWRKLTRDLLVDLQKGIAMGSSALLNNDKKPRKLKRSELKIIEISVHGSGQFDNLTLLTSDHIAQFYDAAEWFVNNQDVNTGGWGTPVPRNLGPGFASLKRGWYSAMGQGHAISLLARAYFHSNGNIKYLKSAIDGLKPFRIPSYHGGVLATFLGKYAWYEEYPTSPPSFVLNGFIYSLLGLYDLKVIAPYNYSIEANLLYEQGIKSLKKMLLLFDTGSGTSYDLRHFTLGIAPNLARWDYHATHVNQLLLLATIDKDPLISQTAERWRGYMFGKKAQHN